MSPDKKYISAPGDTSKANSDSSTVSLCLLTSSDDASYNDFFRIYSESLSTREQKSAAEISAMLIRHDYKTLLLKKDDLTIGFSIVFAPVGESFCLLEYMAIDPAYRNTGFGGQLFMRTVSSIFAETAQVPVLLEVDSDREASADQPIRRRRRQFYRRLNCLQIAKLPYILPLPGEGLPPLMDLMVYFPDQAQMVSKLRLQHWLKLIYRDVYSCVADDSRIVEMLKNVIDPIEII